MTDTASHLAAKGMLVEPGDHFKGRYEVERKFRVSELESIRENLNKLGAVAFTLGNTETDVFFDLPDGRLAENGQFQVLPHMRPSERVLWISKGPGADQCIAMDLSDNGQATAMLHSLGFGETNRIEKKRDIYFVKSFHATLDTVSGLGTFVELAVMTDDRDELLQLRQAVDDMAVRIGLSDCIEETRSYRQMLSEHGK